jgi:hypothetical protein
MATVTDRSTGHLFCGECNLVWCKHIQEFIVENQDQRLIWNDPGYSYWMIMIPYVPAADIWVPVEIDDELDKLGGRKVELLDPESTSATGVILGTISPGEGRAVIRDLLHNWFMLQVSDPDTGKPLKPFCNQGTHKFLEETKFRAHMKDERFRWAELWSLHWYQACISCRAFLASLPDLVPEKV